MPIGRAMYPGSAGASHDHTFLGSTKTDAFSTDSSLRRLDDLQAAWRDGRLLRADARLGRPAGATGSRVHLLPAGHARRSEAAPTWIQAGGRFVGRDHVAAAHGHSLGLQHRGARRGRERAAGVPAGPADRPSTPRRFPDAGTARTSTAPITTRTWPMPSRGGARLTSRAAAGPRVHPPLPRLKQPSL